MDFYQGFSQYYDDIFPLSEEKVNFIKNQFQQAGVNRVIDIGTGTGNYAAALARAGYSVTGIDLNKEMIEQARVRVCQERLELEYKIADMLKLKAISQKRYDGIVVIGNVLVHLQTRKEVDNFLKQSVEVLESPGKIIIQIINYNRIIDQEISELPKIINQDSEVSFIRKYEKINHGAKLNFKTRLAVKENGLIKVYFNNIRLLALRYQELKEMLLKNDYHKIHFYGDFNGGPFIPEESFHCIVVANH